VPTISLGAMITSLGVLVRNLGAPRITVEQFATYILFQNVVGVPGNHCCYISFNHFQNTCIQCVFSSMYLFSNPSTDGISRLAAGGA
jgi:hypothetical protein